MSKTSYADASSDRSFRFAVKSARVKGPAMPAAAQRGMTDLSLNGGMTWGADTDRLASAPLGMQQAGVPASAGPRRPDAQLAPQGHPGFVGYGGVRRAEGFAASNQWWMRDAGMPHQPEGIKQGFMTRGQMEASGWGGGSEGFAAMQHPPGWGGSGVARQPSSFTPPAKPLSASSGAAVPQKSMMSMLRGTFTS